MKIQLKNIGMIEEANVNLDGLTVIAGDNDTGKSTLGKMLFTLIKSDDISYHNKTKKTAKEILATRLNLVFDGNVTLDGIVSLTGEDNQEIAYAHIKDNNYVNEFRRGKYSPPEKLFDATIVQSPIVFDMVDFFNSIAKMKERQKFDYELDFDIAYPYIIWDLFDKISQPNPFPKIKVQQQIHEIIQETIGGELKPDGGKFYYHKYLHGRMIKSEMSNTAFGIKSFGILQLLNENKFFNHKVILILDEPEVHLHPKWQLAMAKVIVQLVKNNTKVLVNSHSPYMVEALQRYSEKEEVEANFYTTQKNRIIQIDESNSSTLEEIFNKLSEPFETFEQMDSDLFNGGY